MRGPSKDGELREEQTEPGIGPSSENTCAPGGRNSALLHGGVSIPQELVKIQPANLPSPPDLPNRTCSPPLHTHE